MNAKVSNVKTRRLNKAVGSIACCLGAYVGAVSLSAQDQAAAFRAPRAETPALAAAYPASARTQTLAQSVPTAVKATIATAR
ncbi:MAG: hypothetical protein KF691_14715 [Phycisphaeraceae bacterium]|nr:hypothetical protein [Phycisphaeraceae bacterium]